MKIKQHAPEQSINKPKHIWSTIFDKGLNEYSNGENTVLSINGAGKIGYSHIKDETKLLYYTTNKNYLKMY